MKFTITIFIIIIFTASLTAFVYVPNYYLKGCPVIVENVQANPYISQALAERLPVRSLLILPLVVDEHGILGEEHFEF